MLEREDKLPSLKRAWSDMGTVHMRHQAIALAPAICDAYDALGEEWVEDNNLIPYDWEFVPAIISLIDWTQPLPTAEAITDALRVAHHKMFPPLA